ncbi:NUDIX domain-containing protein [Microvirga sp. 2MCAF38]|uniref:NUDIX domain-containing protein n=1 Tax=Microvirga sp. 2MCAF38 TaxID=3232989 RepID=UPI003F94B943
MTAYRISKVTTLFSGWRKLLKLEIAMPDGRVMEREVGHNGHAASVLPYDLERRTVVLISQFRAAVMYDSGPSALVETIAGLLDGEEPEICARREALEEAGVRIEMLESVGGGWSAPGATTEYVHLFLAPYTQADRVAEGGGLAEEHEDIEVLEITFAELDSMLAQNRFADLKTIALVQALKLRHPEAFAT